MFAKGKLGEFSKGAVATLLFSVLLAVAVGPFAHARSPSRERIVVPAGSTLIVTIDQALSSKTSQAGQIFSAALARPVTVNRRTVLLVNRRTMIPKGSPITGTVVTAEEQGKAKGGGELALSLTSITVFGWKYPIYTHTLNLEVQEKGKTVVTTEFSAFGNAVLGGLFGGPKRAGIGGATGVAGDPITGNKQVEIPAASELAFTLSKSLDSPQPREVNTTVIR